MGGRLTDALTYLPDDYCLKIPQFESTSLIETENVGTPASMDHGVCWTDYCDDENEPEILNLHTGCTLRGEQSVVSKDSLKKIFDIINLKLPVQSREGIEKYRKAKVKFFSALKTNNFGAWRSE